MSTDETSEAELVEKGVDRHIGAHLPTVDDEETMLREMYGSPDADGIYRGEGA